MAKFKDHRLKSRNKDTVFLGDLDRHTLLRKVKEIESHDIVQYRRTCGFFDQPKKRARLPRRESSRQSWLSSDDSDDYCDIEPYKLGALGLVPMVESKRQVFRKAAQKMMFPKGKNFDFISALILSDLGMLSKFEKKGTNDFVKMQSIIRNNRRYYPDNIPR